MLLQGVEDPPLDEIVQHLAGPLTRALGTDIVGPDIVGRDGVEAIAVLIPRLVPDGNHKFIVRGPHGRPTGVVLWSSPLTPDLVARTVGAATTARGVLGDDLGAVVLLPSWEGRVLGSSAAFMPYRPPFSDSRLRWRWQRARSRSTVFGWLREVTARTVSEESPGDVLPSLEFLAEFSLVSSDLRQAADRARVQLAGGEWCPRAVLTHGDLWKGNLLRAHGDAEPPFWVIDWPASQVRGHAIFDLLKLADSWGLSSHGLATEVAAHAALLGCTPRHARGHLLASLGHTAMNLENFPPELYAGMAERLLRRLDRAVGVG